MSIYAYICLYIAIHPVVYVLAAGAFFPAKNTPLDFCSMYLVDLVNIWRTLWSSGLGEPGSRGWGNRLAGVGGTAGPCHTKAFLIRESKNPFRQAWLGKNCPQLCETKTESVRTS